MSSPRSGIGDGAPTNSKAARCYPSGSFTSSAPVHRSSESGPSSCRAGNLGRTPRPPSASSSDAPCRGRSSSVDQVLGFVRCRLRLFGSCRPVASWWALAIFLRAVVRAPLAFQFWSLIQVFLCFVSSWRFSLPVRCEALVFL